MAKDGASDIEYSIWATYHPSRKKGDAPEKIESTADMDAAIAMAEKMSKDRQFLKIDVKKKYVDPKTERELDMVLKTFERKLRKPLSLAAIIVITLVCAALAFGAAFILGLIMSGKGF